MDAISNTIVQSATALTQSADANAVSLIMLKKSLNNQSNAVLSLVNAAVSSPALATSGNLGTRINTYA